MPTPTEAGQTVRIQAPAPFERERASVLRFAPRLGDAAVSISPTGSDHSVKLYDVAGSVIATATVTVASNVVTATFAAVDIVATLAFGQGYRVEADVRTSDGTTVRYIQPAYVVRRKLHCPVTQQDIEDAYPNIGDTMRDVTNQAQSFIDQAWSDTVRQLFARGWYPEQIVDPDQLAGVVRELALEKLCRFLYGSTQSPTWGELMRVHEGKARDAWAACQPRRDVDQDGAADTEERAGPGQPVVARRAPSGSRFSGWW